MDLATRKKLLTAATNKLKKQLGNDIILDTNDESQREFKVISTGSLLLDTSLGIGGLARGRLIEIAGENSSGKSSICYSVCAQAQKAEPDMMILYVDTEHSVSIPYMEQFGVDTSEDKFIFTQPDTIEQAFTIIEEYARTGLFSLIILDSVGASVTETQLAKGYDESTMGSLAKRMSEGLNKIKNIVKENEIVFLLTNTTYDKLTYMGGKETKGGSGLKFTASVRMMISKRDLIADEDNKERIMGQRLKWKIIKNKLAQPFTEGETTLIFGKGFDPISEITDLAIDRGLIHQGGAWFNFTDKNGIEIKFQGKHRVIDHFKNNEEDFKYFESLIRESLKSNEPLNIETDEDE